MRKLLLPMCLLLAVVVHSGCKPRRSTSGLREGEGSTITVDHRVIDEHYQEGTRQSQNLKYMMERIKSGNPLSTADLKFSDDTIRKEKNWARAVSSSINRFKNGEASIRQSDKRLVQKESANAALAKAAAVFRTTDLMVKTVAERVQTWEDFAMFLSSNANTLAKMQTDHNALVQEIRLWRWDENKPSGVVVAGGAGSPAGGGVVPAGSAYGPPSVVVVAGGAGGTPPSTPPPMVMGGAAEDPVEGGPVANECPKRLQQGATYQEVQNNLLQMMGIFERLAKAQTASTLGLPNVTEVSRTIKGMYQSGDTQFQPGDCGPGKDTAACFGKPLVDQLSKVKELRCLFDSGVGVGEGYSLREHTLMVLQVFANQKGLYGTQAIEYSGYPVENMLPLVLALHDIGKPVAVAKGNKDAQHEYTTPIVESVMKVMGYNRNQILLAKALIDHDLIGPMLVSIDRGLATPEAALRKSLAGLKIYGGSVPNMEFATFGKIQSLYYIADAGSYPWLWSARAFNFGSQANPNCPDQGQVCSRSGAFERLQRIMAGKEALPATGVPMGGGSPVIPGAPTGGNPAAAIPVPPGGDSPFFLDGDADGAVSAIEKSLQEGEDLGGMMRDISTDSPYSSGPAGVINP